MTTIKTKVLDAVHSNRITMIPKWKFVLYSLLGVLSIVFIVLITLFLFSLIMFLLSRYGFLYMPFFGVMATIHALKAIPLFLLFCTIGLLLIIEIVSRLYSFSFKQPLIVTFLSMTAGVTLASFFISEVGVHEYMHEYAKKNHIVMMERMYERPIPFKPIDKTVDVVRGEVLESSSTTIRIRLFNGDVVTAYATTTGEKFSIPQVGDDVMIFGTFRGEQFEIIKIRKAPKPPFVPLHTKRAPMMFGY